MDKILVLLLIFYPFSSATDNVETKEPVLFDDRTLQNKTVEENCMKQLNKSESCEEMALTEWALREENMERGLDRLLYQRYCLEMNKCQLPLFLIPKLLNNGIFCLTKVAQLMEKYVARCYGEKELGKVFEYKSPYGESALKLMALRSEPLPANLRELANSLPNVIGTKVKFDPQIKLASLVLKGDICPEAERQAVLDCFKKGEPIPDPGILHIHDVLSKRQYCARKQDCLRERGLDSPICRRLSQKPAALVCDCAKSVLSWLDLEENEGKWDQVTEKMTEFCQPFDSEDQASELDPKDLSKEVLVPLLEQFFCPETGENFCENDDPVVLIPALWPDQPPVYPLESRVHGIELDGMLPIG